MLRPAGGRQAIFLGATGPRAARPGRSRCEGDASRPSPVGGFNELVKTLTLRRSRRARNGCSHCRFPSRKSPYVQAKIQPRNRISVTAIASSKALSRSIVASLRSVEGRSRGSVAPVLKKVFVELLTLTQPPGLRRRQWLLPVERLSDPRWFDRSNPADHTDAGNRDYKNNHRDHQRHMFPSIHDRSLRPSGHRECEGRHTTSGGGRKSKK